MLIKPDTKYSGTVRPGSTLIGTETGTIGYQVMLTCEDGDTFFIIWLTEKNRQRAIKAFEVLEVSAAKLSQPLFLEADLGRIIEGKEISFGTREDTYKGKTSVKVAWIGKKSEGSLSKDAATFFKKLPPAQDVSNQDNEIPTDAEDPIPF